MKKATKPRERVFVDYLDIEAQEGTMRMYFAIDEYSEFASQLKMASKGSRSLGELIQNLVEIQKLENTK